MELVEITFYFQTFLKVCTKTALEVGLAEFLCISLAVYDSK